MSSSDLPSQTAEIIEECSRFRILVIGTTGVGKSTLINRTFKVNLANVSEHGAGKSNIEDEITFPENPLFVLHDSQGLEPGEVENLNTIKDFVKRRMAEPKIKDRLHAIWLCIAVPRSGGRLFETGTEELLRLGQDALPIVIVFTKFDMLLLQQRNQLRGKLPKEQIAPAAEKEGERFFQDHCKGPLARLAPHTCCVKVSQNDAPSLLWLVNVTYDVVTRHVEGDVWILWAMVQRVSVPLKLEASVAVGMKRYWQGICAKAIAGQKGFKACLDAVHTDMVSVWNFHDPEKLLSGDEFKQMVLTLIERLAPDRVTTTSANLTTTNTITSIFHAISTIAGPVVGIVGLSVTFIKWLHDTYQMTPETLRCQMAYIVDLTAILEHLLLVMLAKRSEPLVFDYVELAFESYRESPALSAVHRDICQYTARPDLMQLIDAGNAEKETSRLVRHYCGTSISPSGSP
ncbi:hypothetical protein JAAARDRAFT_209811 [Jaapia argillacea MUCL 33604]|uniref:G domain-containing protein n=1 Tax=Jaapia argillacea MUCL 33604 TaxID=933084 RepID=A0A067PR60_9AGAM|nr:hypothetical protein JAAARDRAFT_209811 [Jaapia argillacea MUCL 33604]